MIGDKKATAAPYMGQKCVVKFFMVLR